MARTGENIYKRKDGRWEARYIYSRTDSGKARYKYIYGKTYAVVKRRLTESIAESARIAEESKAADMRFEAAVENWLKHKQPNVKESSYAHYVSVLDRQIISHWCGRNIGQITTHDMDEYIGNLLQSGLACKTVDDIFVIIKGIFKHAGKRVSVVCDFTQITVPKSRKEMRVFSVQERRRLEQCLLNGINLPKLGVLLCLYTGIRIGELCALKGENIDLSERVIHIQSTMQRIKNLDGDCSAKTKIVITKPKSKKSVRVIPIPKFLIPIMRGLATEPDSFFLTGDSGSFIEPRTMQNHFKKYLASAKVSDANFHTTRHTFATNAVEQGFDVKSLSEILGHTNVKTTLDLYVHPSFELKRKYMDRLAPVSV
jgi:integrase